MLQAVQTMQGTKKALENTRRSNELSNDPSNSPVASKKSRQALDCNRGNPGSSKEREKYA